MGLGSFGHLLTLESATTGNSHVKHRCAPLVHLSKPTCSDWNNLHRPCLSLPTVSQQQSFYRMTEELNPEQLMMLWLRHNSEEELSTVTDHFATIKPCLYRPLPRLRMPNSCAYYHSAFPPEIEIHTKDSLYIPMATSQVASHLVHLCQRTSTSHFHGENQERC